MTQLDRYRTVSFRHLSGRSLLWCINNIIVFEDLHNGVDWGGKHVFPFIHYVHHLYNTYIIL